MPDGALRKRPIVTGAAIAAGGTIIVPPNDPIAGSGTLVALEIGVNELFDEACTQFGATPLKPAGHAVTCCAGTAYELPPPPPHATKTPAPNRSTNDTSTVLTGVQLKIFINETPNNRWNAVTCVQADSDLLLAL